MFIYFFSILQTMKMQVLAMLQRYRLVSHLRLYLKAKKTLYLCLWAKKKKNKTTFIFCTQAELWTISNVDKSLSERQNI